MEAEAALIHDFRFRPETRWHAVNQFGIDAMRSGRRHMPATARIESCPQLTVIQVAAMVPLTCTPVKGSVHVIGPEAKGALEDLPSSSAWHAAPSAAGE
jgi:hypothetical protein